MENKVKIMFDQTWESFCKDAYRSQGNYQFHYFLDYLIEAVKMINTIKDVNVYSSELVRIENKVKELFDPKHAPAYFSKVNDIKNHLTLLKNDNRLLSSQSGFEIFFEQKYPELFEEVLRQKENSIILDREWSRACRTGEALGLSPWLFLE